MLPKIKTHGADMLWKVGTYEEIEGEKKWNKGDTGRKIETNIFTYIHTNMPHTQLWFYAQILYRTNTFYTQSLLRKKKCYIQTLLHTNTFTHQRIYKHIYTQMFLHTVFLHTNTCTHNPFYTQTLFNTQTFLHTNALNADVFTHKKNYTQALVHANPLPGPTKLEETHRFGHSNIISCKRVAAGPTKLARNLSLKNCFKQNTSCLLCWFNDVER